MYFKRLDERQKVLVYKCGFESFFLLSFMVCVQMFLPLYKVNLFNGQMGLLSMLYISGSYFSIRKAWFDCQVPDEKRRRNRIVMTATTIFLTILSAYMFYDGFLHDGIPFVDADGALNYKVQTLIILISFWIVTGIKWYQKKLGFEKDN